MQSGRSERRMAMSGLAQIEMLDQPSVIESVSVENISEHGVRVIAMRCWQVSERLMVSDVLGGFCAVGKVVYCQPLANNRFAIGLKFNQDAQGLVSEVPAGGWS